MARSVFPADTGNAREVAVGRDRRRRRRRRRRRVPASREFRILEAGLRRDSPTFLPFEQFSVTDLSFV